MFGKKKTTKSNYKKKSVAINKKPTAKSDIHKPTPTNKKSKTMGRTASGRVPQGRTLTTHDNFLSGGKKTGSTKKRPLVVIEANSQNDLAVVPLSSRDGKNRTELKGAKTNKKKTFFKHFVEIADNEGKPIRINDKFKENHKNMDISQKDVENIRNIVFNHSKPKEENKKLINQFRNKKE